MAELNNAEINKMLIGEGLIDPNAQPGPAVAESDRRAIEKELALLEAIMEIGPKTVQTVLDAFMAHAEFNVLQSEVLSPMHPDRLIEIHGKEVGYYHGVKRAVEEFLVMPETIEGLKNTLQEDSKKR